jgi:hypothetical protein
MRCLIVQSIIYCSAVLPSIRRVAIQSRKLTKKGLTSALFRSKTVEVDPVKLRYGVTARYSTPGWSALIRRSFRVQPWIR